MTATTVPATIPAVLVFPFLESSDETDSVVATVDSDTALEMLDVLAAEVVELGAALVLEVLGFEFVTVGEPKL